MISRILGLKQETAKDGEAGLQRGNKIWENWLRTRLILKLNGQSQDLNSSNKIWEHPLRINFNANVYLHAIYCKIYWVTLNSKSQGQGNIERLQLKRSDQGL